MVHKMAKLAHVALLEFLAHLALCVGSNLVDLMAQNNAHAQSSMVDELKVLCKRLEHLLAKFTARVDLLRPVAPVEGHIEPFHRETCAGLLKVTLG